MTTPVEQVRNPIRSSRGSLAARRRLVKSRSSASAPLPPASQAVVAGQKLANYTAPPLARIRLNDCVSLSMADMAAGTPHADAEPLAVASSPTTPAASVKVGLAADIHEADPTTPLTTSSASSATGATNATSVGSPRRLPTRRASSKATARTPCSTARSSIDLSAQLPRPTPDATESAPSTPHAVVRDIRSSLNNLMDFRAVHRQKQIDRRSVSRLEETDQEREFFTAYQTEHPSKHNVASFLPWRRREASFYSALELAECSAAIVTLLRRLSCDQVFVNPHLPARIQAVVPLRTRHVHITFDLAPGIRETTALKTLVVITKTKMEIRRTAKVEFNDFCVAVQAELALNGTEICGYSQSTVSLVNDL